MAIDLSPKRLPSLSVPARLFVVLVMVFTTLGVMPVPAGQALAGEEVAGAGDRSVWDTTSRFVGHGLDGLPDGMPEKGRRRSTTGRRTVLLPPYAGVDFRPRLDMLSGPDLAVVKSVDPPAAAPGQAITYTLAFSNAGTMDVTGVVISDTIPFSVTNTGVISSGVAITQVGGSRYVWNVAPLAVGDGGLITVTGFLSPGLSMGSVGHVFTNTAVITGTGEVTSTNNTGAAGLAVRAPAGAVLVNEVVTDPQQDWSANDFNGVPGSGTISQGVDEWVELYVVTDSLDLAGWTIELNDTTPVSGDLTSSGAFQVSNYVSTGGGSFDDTAAGDILVLGNVDGSGAMNNNVWIVLRDSAGYVVDQVALDAGGAPDGNATDIYDEAVARVPNGTDTDSGTDFVQQRATLGATNDFFDLEIAKAADPQPVVAGRSLTYTLVITNGGNLTATNVIVSDTLPTSMTLQTLDQTDDSPQEFSLGTFTDTHWIDPHPRSGDERLALVDDAFAGTFTSRVFDASNVVSWTTLSWVPDRPYWKPLPDDGGEEWGYAYGEANMSGNRILLHMDSLAGDTITDTSGFDNHGHCPAMAGESCPSYSPGYYFNGGFSFSGTLSQTVAITDAGDPLRYAAELWVWVDPSSVTETTSFILRTDTPTDTATHYSHLLGMVDGHFQHTVYDGGYRTITSTTPITPGVWHHVVGTAETNGDMKLYVDGRLEAKLDGVGTLWEGGGWYRLGSSYGPAGTTLYFTGNMDEVAVYSRTLSSGEVLDHYLRGALRLYFQVRSCDDPACAGESFGPSLYSEWTNDSLTPPANVPLSGISDNRYFQYRAFFESNHPDYSPRLRSVTVGPAHRAVFASQGSCAAEAGAFLCDLEDLSPGGVATITAHVHVHPSALGQIANTATVTATGDLDPANDTATFTSTAESEVYLSISKHDEWHGGSDPVNPGHPMTYTLEVHNGGPSTAWNVRVTDTLPIVPVTISPPSGWDCSASSGTFLDCTVPALLPHSWPDIVIGGNAPGIVGPITNTGWITAQASAVYTTSHLSDTQTTSVEPLADLVVVKTAAPDPVDPGDDVAFVVTVTNEGPSPAGGVQVVDVVLTGEDAHVANSGGWACSGLGDVLTCTLASLGIGLSDSFAITVTAPMSGFVGNRAEVSATTYDPQEEDNVDYAFVSVLPVADLHVTKVDLVDPVGAGTWLTYSFRVTNTGPVPAGAITATLDYANDHPIDIPQSGRAHGYPSNLHVGGLAGEITDLQVTLHGLVHTFPADLSVLLVGPDEQTVVLMSNVGGGVDVGDVTLTFDDAGIPMPVSGTLTSTVAYRPSNYGLSREFYPPAPESPYGGSLSAFAGASPNGLWRLYVMDTVGGDPGGEIAGGWSLHFSTTTRDVITLTDDLPPGVGVVDTVVPPGWSCGPGGEDVVCIGDYLGVNKPAVLTLTVTAPITGGVVTNTVAVTATTADFWPASNQDAVTTTVLAEADLGVVKTVEPVDRVGAGGALTYTLTVSNQGPSPAVGPVVVTDRLPVEITTVVPSGAGWACDLAAVPLITCTLSGGLAVDGTSDLVLAATAPVTSGLVLTNVAAVGAAVSDPITVNNTSLVTVTVAPQANLAVVKTVEPVVVKPNGILTYTVAITNHGPQDTAIVTVTDVITGATFTSYQVKPGWNCSAGAGWITCEYTDTLSSGGGQDIWFQADAPSSSSVVTNTVQVESDRDDLQPADNTSVITVAVTLPPIADAGFDQVVFVDDDLVGLHGVSSIDPDHNDPLTYYWRQTGGPAVNLTPVGSPTPIFLPPGTPTVLSFTLWVTDSLGMVCDQPDTVTITVTDRTVAGLTASNDSPTEVTYPTYFTVAITQGTNVSYTWAFGDGATGVGQTPNHTYAMTGTYTAVVTASNSANLMTATTTVTITAPITTYIYLPLVARNYVAAPDLVVDSIVATANGITVTISNQGDGILEAALENEFWVDVYINPDPNPTQVNQTWGFLADEGLVWGVEQSGLPLRPGDSLVLTTGRYQDGTYFVPWESQITWPLPVGTEVWAQVDSAHEETGYGAVEEDHEIIGLPYSTGGNILGPVFSAGSGGDRSSAMRVERWLTIDIRPRLPQGP